MSGKAVRETVGVPELATRWRRLVGWTKRWWRNLPPDPRVRRGAGWGAALLLMVVAASLGVSLRVGLGWWLLDWLAGGLLGLLTAILAGLAVILILGILEHSRRFFGWMGLASLVVFAVILGDEPLLPTPLPVVGALIFANAILGASVVQVRSGLWKEARRHMQVVWLAAALLGLGVDVYLVSWLADEGSSEHLRSFVPENIEPRQAGPIAAADPSQPGEHRVLTLTYGSGTDYRPEFGSETSLITKTVDARPFVTGSEGWRMKGRHWHFGFDFKEFPVNGRVWYPEGDGPFPLVLIVHGNHLLVERSDPGYAYLGEHLASHGFILVSVDENFFNSFWLADLRTENDGRGWMLLQHLKVWRQWSREEGHPFYGKVDMSRIGLIGHSRGGEAAAIAGAFNRLARYPDDATVKFDFDFDIRAIIAIAPSDGEYTPSDRPTPLKNVNYLVLQGGHDADVARFVGARQWRRVEFDDGRYWFKASIYSYRSNHGQFNTVWGRRDLWGPEGLWLNLEPLLTGEEQRRLGKVYMTAFLEVALHDRTEYVTLFRDHRAGAQWLPRDYYISRFQDSTYEAVCDFEEDIDVTTGSVQGFTIDAVNLATWREEELNLRRTGSKRNKVAFLGWRSDEGEEDGPPPSYSIHLTDEWVAEQALSPDALLVFSLADADEEPDGPEKDDEAGEVEARGGEDEEPLDLSVELESSSGSRVSILLSDHRLLVPPLESRFTKSKDESDWYGPAWSPVLQTFEIPLSAFLAVAPDFDITRLKTIRFIFDQRPEGVLILDDVGFAEPADQPDETGGRGFGSRADKDRGVA